MKILMVLDREFPPDLRVENEIEALTGEGHQVHLACYTREKRDAFEKSGELYIYRKPISEFRYKSSVGTRRMPVYYHFWRKFLSGLVRERGIEAIHVHDLPLVQVGVELKKKYHLPLVADLHENWPAYLEISRHTKSLSGKLLSSTKQWRRYERNILREADRIIVVVDEARERLTRLGLDRERIHVVSNTLNLDHFQVSGSGRTTGTGRNREEVNLFYAGGLNFHRGIQVVIRAMAAAKTGTPGLRFQVLGEGSYARQLKALAGDLGIGQRVIFHGWVPYKKMTHMLMQADYALIPHLKSEHTDSTVPHKLFQYMYAGKPVIASDCDPLARIIHETGAGYIYPSENHGELAALLENMVNRDPRQAAGNGRKWVTEKYNWSADSRVLCNIYHQIKNVNE